MASLSKSERLCDRVLIQDIFSGKNERVGKYPLLLLCQKINKGLDSNIQVLFSVPKKNFPRAVDRNLIKRRMRESFNSFKGDFERLIPENKQMILAVIFTGKEIVPSELILNSFSKIYETLADRLSQTD